MFTDDRISHLAHLLQDRIWKDDLVDFSDDAVVLREIKKTLHKYFSDADEVDTFVRNKIYAMGKKVMEGSQEWDIIYRKYFEEELSKRRF